MFLREMRCSARIEIPVRLQIHYIRDEGLYGNGSEDAEEYRNGNQLIDWLIGYT